MATNESTYTIRVYGYFELVFQGAENVDVARGQAKQQILDTLREPPSPQFPQGRALFNIEKVLEKST